MSTASSRRPGFPALSEHARHWGLDPAVVFLNHGSFGACPKPVLDAQQQWRERLERDPVRFFEYDLEALLDEARGELARFLNADGGAGGGGRGDGLVSVPNATHGVNTVLASLDLKPGDELVTSDQEYGSCNSTLRRYAEKTGAGVVWANVPFPICSPQDVFDAVMAAVTPRTRLVLLSHVTSRTGLIFPVAELVRELDRRGVDTLVDGAHAPGMVPVDIDAIGAAYYTGNCHKWLCAPKGAAFLWARADKREALHPLVVSRGASADRADRTRLHLEFDYLGTFDPTPWLTVPASLRFMPTLAPDQGGWPGVMAANRAATLAGREILCRALNQAPPAPDEMLGSLATIPLPDRVPNPRTPPIRDHDALEQALRLNWGIVVPIIFRPRPGSRLTDPVPRWVRISMQRYNTLEQVEYLARALVEELKKERA